MKSVKKVFFAVAFFAVAVSVSAQMSFGARAGLNVSTINGPHSVADYKPGFHIGLATQFAMNSAMGIESGLYFSSLGAKYGSESTNAYYLQLPLAYYYKFNVGLGLDLYPSAGVYLGYGLSGDNDYFKDKDIAGYGIPGANRFDMGATVGLTLQYYKFTIGLGYDHGFLKTNPEGDDSYTNGNIKVSVGYFF